MTKSFLITCALFLGTLASQESVANIPKMFDGMSPVASLNMGIPKMTMTQEFADYVIQTQVQDLLEVIKDELATDNDDAHKISPDMITRNIAAYSKLATDKIFEMLVKNVNHLQVDLSLYNLGNRVFALSIMQWQNIADDNANELLQGEQTFSEVQVYNF